VKKHEDQSGVLKKVEVESVRFVESDTAFVNRLLGRQVGGKRNILVLNDEDSCCCQETDRSPLPPLADRCQPHARHAGQQDSRAGQPAPVDGGVTLRHGIAARPRFCCRNI
jgi:hypothetical protein